MTLAQFTRRKTLFGLLAVAGAVPAAKMAEAYDLLRIDGAERSPQRLPALFGFKERSIGKPSQLFPKPKAPSRPANAGPAKGRWLDMLEGLKSYGVKGQIAGINAYLNGAADIADIAWHGKAMHWAAPVVYFQDGGGSEDFAVAKYLSLRRLGIHGERLRIVWVEDQTTEAHHAVLTATLDGRVFVLESRFPEIAVDSMLPHYRPYCSANEARFSLHWDPAEEGGVMASLDRLGRRPKKAAT